MIQNIRRAKKFFADLESIDFENKIPFPGSRGRNKKWNKKWVDNNFQKDKNSTNFHFF